ncbi:hypothetical protein COOONC_12440 [Cooperia oncophora]
MKSIQPPNRMLFCFSFLLIFISTAFCSMTLRELKTICPNEKPICTGKALKGDCFGSSLRASVLQKECKCSCDAVHHDRIQKCCKTVGEQEMKFCLPLCRYNTTNEEVCSL